jgi:pseudoazurin
MAGGYANMKTTKSILATAAILGALSLPAVSAEHVINMLNKGADGATMVFEPGFVRAAVGDTVKFVPVDKGHFAAVLPGFWPEGVPEAKGKVNQELVVTMDKEGIYGFKCNPHYPMGMVALVQVGAVQVTDAQKAIKLGPLAAKRMTADIEMSAKP